MNFYDRRDFLVTCSFFVFHFNRGKYFQWTTDHDVIMCREVLVCEPCKCKPRTPERGQSWESEAQQLNSIHQPSFRVTARSVRGRFTLLLTKYAQTLRMQEKVSGIEVEQTELDSLSEEILKREKEAKNDLESKDRNKKSKVEKEKRQQRKSGREHWREPKVENQENKQKTPKVRRSTAEAIDYLRERSDNEKEYRKQKLEVRKREMEVQSEKQDQARKQQQAMFTALMAQMQMQQQSQQSMQAMLAAQQEQQTKLLKAFFENKKKE